MILCSIVAAFFAALSYSYYKIERGYYYGGQGYLEPFYSWIVNTCAFIFALPAGVLLLMKKYIRISIVFTALVLLSGLSLSVILTLYGLAIWPGGLLSGLLGTWPVIALSITALILTAIVYRKS